MKTKQIFWILAIFLIALPLVNAVNEKFFKFNNDLTDSMGGASLTATANCGFSGTYPTFNISGSGSPAMGDCSGGNTYFSLAENINWNSDFTISYWINVDSKADGKWLMSSHNYNPYFGVGQYFASGNLNSWIYSSATTGCVIGSNKNLEIGKYYHILVTKNSTRNELYINGTYDNGCSASFSTFSVDTAMKILGWRNEVTQGQDGRVDHFRIIPRMLNSTEISNEYNYGNYSFMPFTNFVNVTIIKPINNENNLANSQVFNYSCVGPASSFNLTQYIDGQLNYTNNSYQNNTNILRNLTLSFGNHTTTINCTSGASSAQQSISFYLSQQIENTSYINLTEELNQTRFFLEIQAVNTILNVSASLNYNGTVHELEKNIDLSVYHFHFNDTIEAPIVSLNNSKVPFFWNYTIFYTNGSNFTNLSYFNQTVIQKNLFVSSLYENLTDLDSQNRYNLTVLNNQALENATAKLVFNGQLYNATSQFPNYNFTNPSLTFGVNTFFWQLNLNQIQRNSSVQTQNISNVNLTNCSSNGMLFKFNIETTNTQIPTNGTFTFSNWKTLDLIKNYTVIYQDKQNISICIYPNITLFSNYRVTYSSIGYATRSITFLNATINNDLIKTLYLSTNGVRVLVNLKDQNNFVLKNHLIEMYYNNVLIQSDITDANGYASFDYDSAKKYRFVVYDSVGSFLYDFDEMIISSNPLILKLSSTTGTQQAIQLSLGNIPYTLLDYNVSKIINFSWSNNGNYPGRFCLKIINTNDVGTLKIVSNQCIASNPPSSIAYNYSALNGSIAVSAYAEGSTYIIDTFWKTLESVGFKLYEWMGLDAYFWQAILVIILGLAFAYINPAMFFIGVDVALIVGVTITLIPLTWPTIVGIIAVSLISIYAMRV